MQSDPIKEFEEWLCEARDLGEPQHNSMSLATVDSSGHPDCRIVLYKGLITKGFCFYTNYEGDKAKQLVNDPRASLVFYWAKWFRQIRIKGHVEKLTRAESHEYFSSRPRDSQLSAWASPQSAVVGSRESLEQRKELMDQRFKDKEVPCPPFWGGFVLIPEQIEFWIGRDARFHDRFRFTKEKENWSKVRLAP